MSDSQVKTMSQKIEDMEKRYYAALGACDLIENCFHDEYVRRMLLEASPDGRIALEKIAKALRTAYQFDGETSDWYWQPEWRKSNDHARTD